MELCHLNYHNSSRRRSKSLDDLNIEQHLLSCYQDTCTPTSPIVTFDGDAATKSIPKRRHSLCAEPKNTEYVRLATIYGWVYTIPYVEGRVCHFLNNRSSFFFFFLHSESNNTNRRLQPSRSFSHIPCSTGTKLTRMFGRKTPNTAILFPNKTFNYGTSLEDEKNQLPWIVQDHDFDLSQLKLNREPTPAPPIENDPHVFDLISGDSSLFIHYGKCDTIVTSATVEKLVEKLTREMGMFVCILKHSFP